MAPWSRPYVCVCVCVWLSLRLFRPRCLPRKVFTALPYNWWNEALSHCNLQPRIARFCTVALYRVAPKAEQLCLTAQIFKRSIQFAQCLAYLASSYPAWMPIRVCFGLATLWSSFSLFKLTVGYVYGWKSIVIPSIVSKPIKWKLFGLPKTKLAINNRPTSNKVVVSSAKIAYITMKNNFSKPIALFL